MKKNKTKFLPGFLTGAFVMLIVAICVGIGINAVKTETGSKTTISSGVSGKLDFLKDVIDLKYLEKTDEKTLEENIYKGLLQGLNDPYSVYYTKDEYDALKEETSGSYCGIGALVSQNADTGVITAINVFKGSPAEKAGMKNGDIIFKVEDKEVTGEDLNNVVAKMKGEKDTKVKINVYRTSEKEYIDLEITRDKVDVPTVEHKMLDKSKGIGYIQITQFEEVTYDQFKEALDDLKKQGMKSVIFDLRNNPGGLYDTVCEMLDDLLPEGTLVYTKDKDGNKQEKKSDANFLDMPMVVLQNENSASASEIFAGAIQDFGAGKIVGTQSFGKGIVQSIIPLSDGSAVKLTVEKYYTPKGVNIHGKGITPDVKVEISKDGKKDNQLQKAIEVIEKEK
ncbi:S41 family peptidase [Eubacterium sp.]|uniref:S41 family peptidase n=1 Tax=Eubacterium sp. TaxID=142586 RepID=UPI0035219EF3